MDLLTTVRKEGSRGGRGDFKWSDVQGSTHRENYLGHSLMAPVGRWQKGRDLNWYAKGDADADKGEDPAQKAERERKEEIKRVKDAEQDALARALGFEVAPRNPNLEALGDRKEVDKILKDAAEEEDEGGKGVGFGIFAGAINIDNTESGETMPGTRSDVQTHTPGHAAKKGGRSGGSRERRRRSRSREEPRHQDRRRRRHDDQRTDDRKRSRSRDRERNRRVRSRSRSREKDTRRADRSHRERREYRRDRSRSPHSTRRERKDHRKHDDYDRRH